MTALDRPLLADADYRRRASLTVRLVQQFKRSGKARGKVDCPECEGGHVRAELLPGGGSRGRCTTEGCLEWTE